MSEVVAGGGRARTLVCVPTYNERDNLPITLRRLRAAVPEVDILVLDDASPDGTGTIADELAAQDEAIRVHHRPAKAGLGAAYLDGFRTALAEGYDVIVEMDADGSHQPEQLPDLLDALDDADMVLGSRYLPGGEVVNWPWHRLVLSRGGNAYVRLLLGVPLRDATGGFRAYRRSALERLDLADVSSQGYCFQVDLALRALRCGLRVTEVPITFVERTAGTSKMSNRIVAEAFARVAWWGLTRRAPRGAQPRVGDRPDGAAGPELTSPG